MGVSHFGSQSRVYKSSYLTTLSHCTISSTSSIVIFFPLHAKQNLNIILTHPQAALSAFSPSSSNTTLSPHTTIEDVFASIQNCSAYRGVVPFENSSNGSVVFTLDLFADLQKQYPDILVCGEAYVAVRHCLLGYTPSSNIPQSGSTSAKSEDGGEGVPLHDLSHIKTLYSHPQAWGQCKTFLSTYLKNVERRDVSSTSRAAEIASQDKTGESAALSSMIAADLFNLSVLAEGINDNVGNTTRFLVLRHASTSPSTPSLALLDDWKSLITFTVDHANPGALAHCLSVFEKYGLNLTSINTRPSGVQNWNYIFFVEFKGRKEDGREESRVNKALGELEGLCRGFRWLGSWENRLPGGG
jgi:prephenate dehydratase